MNNNNDMQLKGINIQKMIFKGYDIDFEKIKHEKER